MPYARSAFSDLETANPLYIGALVSFYAVDVNGAKTATLATLYQDSTSANLAENPQTLDSFGKLTNPIYIQDPVIATISGGPNLLAAHDTGIVSNPGRVRVPYVSATQYYPNDLIQDPATGNIYYATESFISVTVSNDLATGKIALFLQPADLLAVQSAAAAAAAAAASAVASAASSTTSTTEAGIATTEAGIATTQATNASTSSTSAAASATAAAASATIASQFATAAALGGFKGLIVGNNNYFGTLVAGPTVSSPNSQVGLVAEKIVVSSGGGSVVGLSNVNLLGDITTSGAGGLDTGSVTPNTWYFIFVIYNPSTLTTNLLFSINYISFTLPAGYTAFARVGAVRTDGSSHFYRFQQAGRKVQYAVTPTTNTAALPQMASGNAGNVSTPTYVGISVGSFIPPSASSIKLVIFTNTGTIMVAPNASYGPQTSNTNPPLLDRVGGTGTSFGEFNLESGSIFWASNDGSGVLACVGWEDNL